MAEQRRCRARSHLTRLAIVFVGLVGSGCTYTSNGTGPGTLSIQLPGTLPALTAQPPPASAAPPPNGTFAGIGQLSSSAGSGCRRQIQITNFVVMDGRVRFQGFRGTIGPDTYLTMQGHNAFLYGYFDGGRFIGSWWRPPPACSYNVVLDHLG